jgi:hypothetical protein
MFFLSQSKPSSSDIHAFGNSRAMASRPRLCYHRLAEIKYGDEVFTVRYEIGDSVTVFRYWELQVPPGAAWRIFNSPCTAVSPLGAKSMLAATSRYVMSLLNSSI